MGKLHDQEEDEFDGDDTEDEAEESVEAEADAPADSGGSSAPAPNHEEAPEDRTVASRQKQREEMAQEIEAFLAKGGRISQIEPNVTADPPRKPDSDYGSRPI